MSLVIDSINSHPVSSMALIGDDRSLTYGQLVEEVNKKALYLEGCNVLGIDLPNGLDWIIWDLAALKAGVVCVPLPPFFTYEQKYHIISSAGISHIISDKGLYKTGAMASKNIHKGTAKITFTSGSTGSPKGVCLSQESMEEVSSSIIDVIGSKFAKDHMSILPLSILLENIAGVYTALISGCSCHIYSSEKTGMNGSNMPDLLQMVKTLSEKKITSVILVPELLNGLIGVIKNSGIKLPDLKFIAVGGSKIAPELINKAHKVGLPVYEGYGLSECGSVVSLNTPNSFKSGTAGKILPHVKLGIIDDEVVISNPGFLGYLGEPHSGFYNTGDLGNIDKDGFLYINGRKKNLLITSYGRNISPEWVESHLLAHDEIMQAFVYGDAEPKIKALIVTSSRSADINEIIDKVNMGLPDYAQVGNFNLVEPFSKEDKTLSSGGRIKRDVVFKKYKTIINDY